MALGAVTGGSSIDNRRNGPICSRKPRRHAKFQTLFTYPGRQLNGEKSGGMRSTCEFLRRVKIGSHSSKLISVAGLDDDRNSFIRAGIFGALSALCWKSSRLVETPENQLRARDDQHDFAFRRMCLIVC